MGKEKKKWLAFSNRLLSGALVLLGFASCEGGDTPCEYGTPHADYEIKGKVQNEEGQPMKGMRVIVTENPSPTGETYPGQCDTLYTGDAGEYLFEEDYAVTNKYRVVCEDPNGVYKADSVDVNMKPEHGKGWYMGSDSKEIDFELKKKEK